MMRVMSDSMASGHVSMLCQSKFGLHASQHLTIRQCFVQIEFPLIMRTHSDKEAHLVFDEADYMVGVGWAEVVGCAETVVEVVLGADGTDVGFGMFDGRKGFGVVDGDGVFNVVDG
jgi:hypothetical protein